MKFRPFGPLCGAAVGAAIWAGEKGNGKRKTENKVRDDFDVGAAVARRWRGWIFICEKGNGKRKTENKVTTESEMNRKTGNGIQVQRGTKSLGPLSRPFLTYTPSPLPASTPSPSGLTSTAHGRT